MSPIIWAFREVFGIIVIDKFLGFFNLILIFTLILILSVWFPYCAIAFIHLVLITILCFIGEIQQQNNGLDIHNDIESESPVDIPTVLLPNEALPTETTNLRDSPPSYTDVGPPPNYEDVAKDLKVSIYEQIIK